MAAKNVTELLPCSPGQWLFQLGLTDSQESSFFLLKRPGDEAHPHVAHDLEGLFLQFTPFFSDEARVTPRSFPLLLGRQSSCLRLWAEFATGTCILSQQPKSLDLSSGLGSAADPSSASRILSWSFQTRFLSDGKYNK